MRCSQPFFLQKAAEEARERERRAVAEAERLEREQQRRLAERKRLIEEEIHIASVTAYLKSVSRDASSFTREELLEMTVESLQHEQAEKEARSAKRAQESHFKREQELDFFTQALRGKEAEKLQSWIDARLQEDGKYAEQQELSMVERAKKLHADTIVVKERLARMESYIMNFEELVSEKRAAEHEAALVSLYVRVCISRVSCDRLIVVHPFNACFRLSHRGCLD